MGGPQGTLEIAAGTGRRALMGQGYGTRFDLIMPHKGFSLLSLVLITLARRTYMLQNWLATAYKFQTGGRLVGKNVGSCLSECRDGKLHSLPTSQRAPLTNVVQSRTR